MKLPVNFGGMPDGTDVKAMRKWVEAVFTNPEFLQYQRTVNIRRGKAVQTITKTIVSIPCSDESGQSFDLWIYEPAKVGLEDGGNERPAILMFHGGGWIHGNPSGDECW